MLLQKPMLGTQLDHSDSLNNPVLDLLMNEGHGDVVQDLSGYGNHGTLHGFDFPPTHASGWNPGTDGIGLNFDGVDDYISVPNSSSLDLTDALTIEILFCHGDTTWDGVLNKGDTSNGFVLGAITDNRLQMRIAKDSVVDEIKSSALGGIQLNTWYHAIGTFDGNLQKLRTYINGVLQAEINTTNTQIGITTYNLLVGNSADGSLNGSIARVRILPRAMSEFEVMQRQIDPYGVYQQ